MYIYPESMGATEVEIVLSSKDILTVQSNSVPFKPMTLIHSHKTEKLTEPQSYTDFLVRPMNTKGLAFA